MVWTIVKRERDAPRVGGAPAQHTRERIEYGVLHESANGAMHSLVIRAFERSNKRNRHGDTAHLRHSRSIRALRVAIVPSRKRAACARAAATVCDSLDYIGFYAARRAIWCVAQRE